jgi:hypothetical protein
MTTSDDRRGGFAPWCSAVSDMWRTSRDLEPNWESVMFNLGTMVGRGKDAGPYVGWNNPDVSRCSVYILYCRKGSSCQLCSHIHYVGMRLFLYFI